MARLWALTAAALLAATAAEAAPLTILVDIDPAVCDWAAGKAVAGQTDDNGQPLPPKKCVDYLADLLQKAADSWAKARDGEIVMKAMEDPVKRQKLVEAAKKEPAK